MVTTENEIFKVFDKNKQTVSQKVYNSFSLQTSLKVFISSHTYIIFIFIILYFLFIIFILIYYIFYFYLLYFYFLYLFFIYLLYLFLKFEAEIFFILYCISFIR